MVARPSARALVCREFSRANFSPPSDTFLDSVMTNGGVPSDAELEEVCRVLRDNGVTLYDTAEGYGFGESEKRVALAARSMPAQPPPVLMSKFMPTVWRWTKGAFFDSLRRTTERLGGVPDIYFVHTPVHPLFLQWVECAFEAKRRGLIKAVGLSNCAYNDVAAALKVAEQYNDAIAANQVSGGCFEWIRFCFDNLSIGRCCFLSFPTAARRCKRWSDCARKRRLQSLPTMCWVRAC